ncbi:MAG: hypothetical protein EOP61_08050 [Sphingomonadales bacterium]|nr:MAG: hypothetical protein EOP61_08050 [Sphingomonadales bacterium]
MRGLKTMLIALAALIAPVAATAQTEITAAPGPWSPPSVAVSFPETIGEYRRVRVTEFGPRNYGVGYVLERGGKRLNTLTVFVYTYGEARDCREEFESARTSILKANPAATLRKSGMAASPRGTPGAALHASYAYTAKYAETQALPLTSDLYLYCKPGSQWFVKARTSWPASSDMSGEAATILRAINWPSEVTD